MQPAAIRHRAYGLDDVHIRIDLFAAAADLTAVQCIWTDRYLRQEHVTPMTREATDGTRDYWGCTVALPTRRLRYRFRLRDAAGQEGETAPAELPYNHPADRFTLPSWLAGTTIYQVFPDRFKNGDPANDPPGVLPWGAPPTPEGFHGGDLEGIAAALDYLAGLGVGCLYMTPVFRSPSNHKYDTADYLQVDPCFGGNAGLRRLVSAAHGQGIRVILDMVFNHSGAEWFAFRDVREKGADSPYKDWFFRIDSFPVDMEAINYETWAHRVPTMPKLNTAHPGCARYLLDVARHWLEYAGVDGYRLDVANEVNMGFWRDLRRLCGDRWLLGEIWDDAGPWLQGDQFHSVTHYPWRQAVLRFLRGEAAAPAFAAELARLRYLYPQNVLAGLVHLLGGHDSPRVRTELGGSSARVALAAVLLFTAPGVPLVYYGDEVGMEGGDDPDCRRCMEWDPARQERRLQDLFRRLIHFRRQNPWLSGPDWVDCEATGGLYVYRRRDLWVAVNAGDTAQLVTLPGPCVDILTNNSAGPRVELPPVSAAILRPQGWVA